MYFLLLYAIITLISWVLALNIRPDRYRNATIEAVFEWKYRRLKSCKLYSFLTLVFLFLLIIITFLASEFITPQGFNQPPHIPIFLSISVFVIYIYMAYMLFILFYRFYKDYRFGKDLGVL